MTDSSFTQQRRIASTVTDAEANQRLDLFLTYRFNYLSRNQWQKLIDAGHIRVNDRAVRASRILSMGDVVAFLPPDDVEEPPVDTQVKVIYEDDEILAVNKTGNLPCHPSGVYFNNTLTRLLEPRYGALHVVTRLDRETSGVVLCVKKGADVGAFNRAVTETATKVYYALVQGNMASDAVASGFLFKHPTSPVRKKRAFAVVVPENQHDFEACHTTFRPLTHSRKYTLVEATPLTGRLHQIRATLCSLGFPLVGDKLYGINDHYYLKFISDQLSQLDYKMLLMKRQALHAVKLSFVHPFTHQMLQLNAPFPEDMRDICNQLKLNIQVSL